MPTFYLALEMLLILCVAESELHFQPVVDQATNIYLANLLQILGYLGNYLNSTLTNLNAGLRKKAKISEDVSMVRFFCCIL